MEVKVKELIEKLNGAAKRTKIVAAICMVVAVVAAIVTAVAVRKRKAISADNEYPRCFMDCDKCKNTKCEYRDEEFDADDDCCEDDESDDAKVMHVFIPVMSLHGKPYVSMKKCENYDSDLSAGRGNCESKACEAEAECDSTGTACKCVECFLNAANGGPCVHCQNCENNPIQKEAEEEKSEEVTE